MTVNKIAVLFGHSHLGALIEAIDARAKRAEHVQAEHGLHIRIFENWLYGGECPYIVTDETGREIFNPRFLAASERPSSDGERSIFVSFGGNAHNTIGLIQHPEAFDFVLPENPLLPINETATIVPSGYLADVMAPMMDIYTRQLRGLRSATNERIYFLEAPPPLGDREFIHGNLDAFFAQNFQTAQISSDHLRYKLWRLQSGLQRRLCEKLDVQFVEVPRGSKDDRGFLKREFYGRDATHANGRYGALVLDQIEAATQAPLSSWSTFAE